MRYIYLDLKSTQHNIRQFYILLGPGTPQNVNGDKPLL